MVLVFLCLGGWLPSHLRRDTCNHGAAPVETRWTWLRAADYPDRSGVKVLGRTGRLSRPPPPPGHLERHETPDPGRPDAVEARFHGVRPQADRGVCPPPDPGRAVL